MVLPVNVATCTVTGAFVNADGSIPASGSVTFTPVPARILDATATPPTTIVGTPTVATLTAGAFSVTLPATDDTDLNPTGWTYHVAVRLPTHAYSFCMDAPEGAVDLAEVTPIIGSEGDAIIAGPPGPAGPSGDGQGVPEGGATGEILAKLSGDDYDTDWVPASAPGVHTATHAAGSTDPVTVEQSQVTGLVAGLAAKQPLDSDLTAIAALAPSSDAVIQRKVGMWVASTPTEYKTDLNLTKSDVGLGNVDNTSDANKPVSTATTTALNLKANAATTFTPTAPLTGGGSLAANRTLAVSTFSSSSSGVVPASDGTTTSYLRADGTWTAPPGAFAGVGNTATFSYNTTTTEPPTGNQLRLNSTTFTAATRLWVMQTTVDGLDVSIGLARILAGHQIYFQDRDDASHWVKYNVTSDGVDDGAYYDFTVTYHSGPGAIPAGQIELQAVAPGTVGVPPGGANGEVLAKASGADYDVDWIAPAGGGGGISTEDAVDAVATALTEGVGIDLAYDDGAGTITVTVDKTELSLAKGDVGLGNVDNTTDAAKPVSTATQTALDAKQPLDSDLTAIAALTATTGNMILSASSAWTSATPATVKTALSLNNVDNTADTAKPVSTAQATAIALKVDKAQTINAQTGTTYTLVLTDDSKLVTLSNAGAITLTVPPNSSVAFPTGTRVDLGQLNTGAVTVVGGSGVTVNATPSLVFRARYSAATLTKYATDTWLLVGDLATP